MLSTSPTTLPIPGAPPLLGLSKSNLSSEAPAMVPSSAELECGNAETHRLTPTQIQALAKKVYALLLDELRIEAERYGRVHFR